jgi:hypothetical protein
MVVLTDVEGQQGYDFSEQQLVQLQNGDFYWTGASNAFWANNLGQRGVVSVGPCSDPREVDIPTSG